MKYLLLQFALSSAAIAAVPSQGTTYNVLNRNGTVITVPQAGGDATTLLQGPNGAGFAIDANGDVIIANVKKLVRVTPNSTSSIASAPAGSQFIDVTIDGNGRYLVTDNKQHGVFRISPDGSEVTSLATYPVVFPEGLEDSFIRVHPVTHDYIVIEDSGKAHLHVIKPDGKVLTIGLTGSAPRKWVVSLSIPPGTMSLPIIGIILFMSLRQRELVEYCVKTLPSLRSLWVSLATLPPVISSWQTIPRMHSIP